MSPPPLDASHSSAVGGGNAPRAGCQTLINSTRRRGRGREEEEVVEEVVGGGVVCASHREAQSTEL